MMSKSFTKFIGQTVLMSLLLGAPSVAQTAVIDEVIVTTTRSDSLRIDNPGNIATLDPSQTVNLFPVELLNQAPGVHIHRGSGQEHLTAIRSPVLVGGAGAGSFLYLEDGIPMRAPGFANVNALMDAMPQADGSVELVRGPGSALYGSNAVHGLVNFISAPLDESGTSADIAIGSYARHAVSLQSAQDHGTFMTRLSLDLNGDADGYRDAQSFAQQKTRFESAWQDGATGYRLSIAHMNLNQETAGYAASYEDETIARGNNNSDAYRDAAATRTYLRMTTDLDSGATLMLTPYFRTNDMEFRMHFLPGTANTTIEENSHNSIGLQVAYARDTDSVSYVSGIDIEATEGELTEVQSGADKYAFRSPTSIDYAQGTHYDFEVEAQVIAPYLHAVWALSDATDLTTGLRWEMTDYDYTNNTDTGRQGKLYRPANRSDDFSDVSPKIGLVHRLADNRRVFANLARAARAPQTTDIYRLRDQNKDGEVPEIEDIDSEVLDSLEIGYRAVYPALSYEATAFVMQKENYHFRDGNDYYETDGETDHMGIELSLDWMLARDWTLATNLTYAKHEYAFDRNVGGGNSLETVTDGDTIDGAPETLANTSLRYKYDERTFIKLHWEHVGSYYLDASNSAEYDGHDIFAVTNDYVLSGQSRLILRIDNLFDEAYAKRADKWFGNDRYFPGEGRRFMARISHTF
jgi:outer membrane receptor protein involved in Fe transport